MQSDYMQQGKLVSRFCHIRLWVLQYIYVYVYSICKDTYNLFLYNILFFFFNFVFTPKIHTNKLWFLHMDVICILLSMRSNKKKQKTNAMEEFNNKQKRARWSAIQSPIPPNSNQNIMVPFSFGQHYLRDTYFEKRVPPRRRPAILPSRHPAVPLHLRVHSVYYYFCLNSYV